MKITIIRKDGTKVFQRTLKLDAAIESFKTESKSKLVLNIREESQNLGMIQAGRELEKLPHVIFSTEFTRKDGVRLFKRYNGLVVVTVGKLKDMKEAAEVRQKVARLPQTMAAFIGTTGTTVNILIPFTRPDLSLPQTQEEAEIFHAHAFQWAATFYLGQLMTHSIAIQPSKPDQGCPLTYDPELYFNPDTYPVIMKQPLEMPVETTCQNNLPAERSPLEQMMPGFNHHSIISTLFEAALHKAMYEIDNEKNPEEQEKTFLVALAAHCHRSGIPQEEATHWTVAHFRNKIEGLLIRETFRNVYDIEKHFGKKPYFPAKQTLSLQIDEYMNRRYYFRQNTMTGSVEYREKNSFFYNFRPVTEKVLNTIAINALSEGIDMWDRDIKRWINSNRVPLFSPIEDFLSDLPQWDGTDRIRALAQHVPCENPHWPDFFHRWFLCMTAHWRGYNKKFANSTSPLLIGAQGCGKSTFCRNILPPELRAYYTDSIDFSRKHDAEMYLNRFALVNIDEFDQISASHQGFLKHIMQKPVVNIRKPHQTAIQELRRYASFIATSNHTDLLSDTSGNRRFICINVTAPIQNRAVINYQQLYAQALKEIQYGERYWFSAEEEAILMESNKDFEVENPTEQLFLQYFRPAEENEEHKRLLAVEILGILQKKSGFKLGTTTIIHFGRILKKLKIQGKRTKNGMQYRVVER
jgi:hypothetical protein